MPGTVGKRRRRFAAQRRDGLRVEPRSGAPRTTNFAKTGNPNGGKLPRWVMHLGDEIAIGPVEHQARLAFFAKLFAATPAK